MSVELMNELSTVKTRHGKSLQHSEQAVAVLSTQIDKESSEGLNATPETVKALTAITMGLLKETLSGDAIYLAMGAAKKVALESGVSLDEFHRVESHILRFWARSKSRNPLAGMF